MPSPLGHTLENKVEKRPRFFMEYSVGPQQAQWVPSLCKGSRLIWLSGTQNLYLSSEWLKVLLRKGEVCSFKSKAREIRKKIKWICKHVPVYIDWFLLRKTKTWSKQIFSSIQARTYKEHPTHIYTDKHKHTHTYKLKFWIQGSLNQLHLGFSCLLTSSSHYSLSSSHWIWPHCSFTSVSKSCMQTITFFHHGLLACIMTQE